MKRILSLGVLFLVLFSFTAFSYADSPKTTSAPAPQVSASSPAIQPKVEVAPAPQAKGKAAAQPQTKAKASGQAASPAAAESSSGSFLGGWSHWWAAVLSMILVVAMIVLYGQAERGRER